jgi:hypothetical protein
MAVTQTDGARQLRFTGNLDLQTNKIVNLTDPTANQEAATKAYVDAQVAGGVIDFKESIRVATTSNGTFASAFTAGQTVDGVTLVADDRILLKNQSTGNQNGIYDVTASGAPVRSSDANTSAEVTTGMFAFIEEGTSNADTGWLLTTTGSITLDTTALTFEKFSQTGQLLGDLVAGAGLTKTAETVDVVAATSGGLTANANDITINLDTNSGLNLGAGGISVGAGSGLAASGGDVNIGAATSGGITVNADDIEVNLDGSTLALGSSGLSLADGASAALLVGQGASDTTYNAVGGDLTMSSSAAFTIADSYVTDTWVTRETPTGTVNGSNTDFTMAATPLSNTDCIYLNGIIQNTGGANDYTLSGAIITFNTAPESGDVILVNYNQ